MPPKNYRFFQLFPVRFPRIPQFSRRACSGKKRNCARGKNFLRFGENKGMRVCVRVSACVRGCACLGQAFQGALGGCVCVCVCVCGGGGGQKRAYNIQGVRSIIGRRHHNIPLRMFTSLAAVATVVAVDQPYLIRVRIIAEVLARHGG